MFSVIFQQHLYNALTLLFKGHLASKNLALAIPKVLFWKNYGDPALNEVISI